MKHLVLTFIFTFTFTVYLYLHFLHFFYIFLKNFLQFFYSFFTVFLQFFNIFFTSFTSFWDHDAADSDDTDIITHLATALSIRDLHNQVSKRIPEGIPLPSKQWLRLQFWL